MLVRGFDFCPRGFFFFADCSHESIPMVPGPGGTMYGQGVGTKGLERS